METRSRQMAKPELAAVQMSLICVSMCGLDNRLASVSSKGKCLTVPTAFSILQGKDRGKVASLAVFTSLVSGCSKWSGACCHRNQFHMSTLFYSSGITNIHVLWGNNLESLRHKII